MSDRLRELASGGGMPAKRGFWAWIAGRSGRREYWLWVVPWLIAVTAASLVAPTLTLLLGLPLLFFWIRRLHDLGWSGWLAPLINIAIGMVGWIEMSVTSAGGGGGPFQSLAAFAAIIALGVIPGQPRRNEYGPPTGRKPDLAETFT